VDQRKAPVGHNTLYQTNARTEVAEVGKDKHSGGRLLLLLATLFIFGGTAIGQDTKITDTDLCSLIKHPERFNKKRVRVNARVESAVIEGGTWLEDAACGPDGVELSVPGSIRNHPDEHPGFRALDDAIRRQGNIGTVGKKITATFTGKFTLGSKRPKRILTLEKIENLDVKVGG
jgi:hypothetical protein